MKFLLAATILLVAAIPSGHAQEPPPATPAPVPIAPPPPVLENTGKPLAVSFQCSTEDIQAAGLSCSEEDPCSIFLELTAVESVGNRIFAAGNIHSAAVTMDTVLLASEDDGHTWREVADRIRGAGLD